MMTFQGRWHAGSIPLRDIDVELAGIVSMLSAAHDLEADVSDWGFDPALSGFLDDAEMLWATAGARLQRLSLSPAAQEPIAIAAQHLLALIQSDGADPGQDRLHLRGLASAAERHAIPAGTRAQLAHAEDVMSQIFAAPDPFEPAATSFPLTPFSQGV